MHYIHVQTGCVHLSMILGGLVLGVNGVCRVVTREVGLWCECVACGGVYVCVGRSSGAE